MSKKPTSIRKAKKLAKQLSPQSEKLQDTSFRKKEKEITLHEAYEIIGGYTNTISPRVYERAFKMVMEVDPQFAKALKELHIQGTSFKNASEEQLATAEQIVQNAQDICTNYSDDSLYNEVIEDKEIVEAYENTPVNENLSDEEYRRTTFAAAQNEVISELTESVEYSQASSKKKRNLLVSRLKISVKRILFGARRVAAGNDIASIKKALNFKEKISVSASSIASAYENAQKRTTVYIKKLYQKGHTKAAAFLNKAKTKVHSSMIKLATASILLTSLLPSCNNGSSQAPIPAEQQKTVVLDDTTRSSANIVSSVSTFDTTQQAKAVSDSIAAPTEWNDSLGVSKGNWTVNQTFMDYGKAYQKITDDMLEKSGFQTRDQFLDAYRILRSFYPKVIENQGDVLLARSETSEKFSKFFNNDDCVQAAELTAEDYEILKIAPELRGNLNRRSTQEIKDGEPCEPGKVQYEDVATLKDEHQEPVKQEPTFQFEEQGQSTIVEDTVPQYTISEEGGSSRIVNEVVADTVSVNINLLKGNSLNDGRQIGTIQAEDIAGRTTTVKKDILVEQTNQNGSQDSAAVKPQFTFEETGTSRVDTTATAPQFTFEEEGSSRVDTTAIVSQFTFEEAGSSRVDTTATVPQFTFEEAGTSRTVLENTYTTTATDSVQIVSDSADLPVGTPAAGYVEERGGVDNCGLTAKQLQYSKSKIADRYGESAYEDLMNGISDEMLAKGNVFEGLTREQAIYNLSVWSVVYPHSAETALIYDYVLNCHQGETMSADDMAKAKAAMDKIRINKTIDGATYNKPVYVKNVKNMGCDERVQVNSVRLSGDVISTSPSGPKFPRLFSLRAVNPEPIKWAIEELGGTSRTEVEYVVSETKSPTIQLYKGNNTNISEGKYLGDIDAKDIVNREVTNRKDVLVESSSHQEDVSRSAPETSKTKRKVKKGKKMQSGYNYDDLTPEQKAARLEAAKELVKRYRSY